ncbi:MAG: NCS2 family permease [Saccharofermentanales bacterium]|jgi:AGZA family xanthine/uracil permease-like MFS transporter
MLEKSFKLKERGVTVKGELAAGLTTFMTMAYILAVNPQILSATGMNAGGVLIATALSSAVACVCMAFMANLPFALAPGMGLNAYFAYTVVLSMGYPWEFALFAVFVEGLIFIVLSLTNVREAIFDAIPLTLKHAVGAGIGLFIAFIGLQNSGLVQGGPTLVELIPFKDTMGGAGLPALLTLLGVLIIGVLAYKKVRGSLLIGMFAIWIVGIILQAAGLYVPNPEAGLFSLYPSWGLPDFAGFGSIAGKAFSPVVFQNFNIPDFLIIMISFLFVDIFDTLGTLIGVADKADMLDKDGKLPRIKGALMADAVGTVVGAVAGTSTVTTYVESASGVAEGGRTGLTALTTGVLFLLAIILAPIFISVPAFATSAALIYVGFLMLSSILKVDFSDISEALPAYIALFAMPFFYSISHGIMFGIIFYVLINMLSGKFKKISPLMYVLALAFILKFAFLG